LKKGVKKKLDKVSMEKICNSVTFIKAKICKNVGIGCAAMKVAKRRAVGEHSTGN
jgi:hypothetical protein